MARTHTTDRDLGLRRLIRELQVAKVTEVVIGVQEGSNNGDGESIAEYAAYNEFGTEKIPERSFMRSAFDEHINDLSAELDRRYAQVQAGTKTVYQALGLAGLMHQDQIKNKIDTNVPPPNSPVTVAQKGSSHTLIDTGAMKNSIHYIIRRVS
jgi:HK97 gp10 family phage protein